MTEELSQELIRSAITTAVFGTQLEYYAVAVSAESLALAWLRQRDAPHGALVVVDREISPRGRIDRKWTTVDGLATGIVLRPVLSSDAEDLLWALAATAACRAYRALGSHATVWWPDLVLIEDRQVGAVKARALLGPGVVESAILTFQLDTPASLPTPADRIGVLNRLLVELERADAAPTAEIVAEHRRLDAFVGQPIAVSLKPRGTIAGIGRGIDERGRLLVEGASGKLEPVGVDQVRIVERDTFGMG